MKNTIRVGQWYFGGWFGRLMEPRNNLTRHAILIEGTAGDSEAAGASRARKSGPPAGATPLPPLKTRFSPRLARALFMSLLMHHRHPPESGLDPWAVADHEAACADAF